MQKLNLQEIITWFKQWKNSVLTLVFFSACAMIILAARGDLWLDEIWSISFSETASSPWDIFTNYKHDNNHLLNTWYLFLIGKQNTLLYYRLLSIISGIGSVFLLGFLARSWGRIEGLLAVTFAGTSYPLILYFSEARGYAPAIFFSLLSFAMLNESRRSFTLYKVAIFWAAIILGTLSHATFLFVFMALMAYSLIHELHDDSSLVNRLLRFGTYYFVPGLFFVFYYLFFINGIQIGGATTYTKWHVIGLAATLCLGLPDSSIMGITALIIGAAVVVTGSFLLYKEKNEKWVLFPVAIFIAPALIILVSNPEFPQFRYFILCFPFFYLLLSYILGKIYNSSNKIGKWIVPSFMILFIIGQSQHLSPLFKTGRGDYRVALQKIYEESDTPIIRIGSDHDFRNNMLVVFYSRLLPQQKQFRYINRKYWFQEKPEWIIMHSQDIAYKPQQNFAVNNIGNYILTDTYDFSGHSGWRWFVYRLK